MGVTRHVSRKITSLEYVNNGVIQIGVIHKCDKLEKIELICSEFDD